MPVKITNSATTENKRRVGYKVFVESFEVAKNSKCDRSKLISHIRSLTFIRNGKIQYYTDTSINNHITAIKRIFNFGKEWEILKEASISNKVDENTQNAAKKILAHYGK